MSKRRSWAGSASRSGSASSPGARVLHGRERCRDLPPAVAEGAHAVGVGTLDRAGVDARDHLGEHGALAARLGRGRHLEDVPHALAGLEVVAVDCHERGRHACDPNRPPGSIASSGCSRSAGTAPRRATDDGWEPAQPERAPDITYLASVAQAAEDAGAQEILIPTGSVNDSFAPDAPFMESWTTAAALAAMTRRIRLLVAVNPAALAAGAGRPPGADALVRRARADRDQPGGRGRAGRPATAAPRSTTTPATPRLGELADALRERFPGSPLPGRRKRGGQGPGRARGRHVPDVGGAARTASPSASVGCATGRRPADALRPAHPPHRPQRRSAEALVAARELSRRAEVAGRPRREYGAFDSEGQARMNALAGRRGGLGLAGPVGRDPGRARRRGHRAGGLARPAWRGCSTSTAEAGVDLVIASGYPHLEEVTRVARRVWPRLTARAVAVIRLARPPPARPGRGAGRALRHPALRLRRRPHRGRGPGVPGAWPARRRPSPTR